MKAALIEQHKAVILRSIESSVTLDHFKVCLDMIDLFYDRFKDDKTYIQHADAVYDAYNRKIKAFKQLLAS